MNILSFFPSKEWYQAYGLQIRAEITNLGWVYHACYDGSIGGFGYQMLAEACHPLTKKRKKFRCDISDEQYESLKKGHSVVVYIHPKHAWLYWVDL